MESSAMQSVMGRIAFLAMTEPVDMLMKLFMRRLLFPPRPASFTT